MRDGFVPLGELTALLGANDSGKSRLLGTVMTALTSPRQVHPRFYAALEPAEIPQLLHALIDLGQLFPNLRRPTEEPFRTEWQRNPVSLALAEIEAAKRDPEWLELCGELARSPCFAFEWLGQDSWSVAWCLPAPATLDAPLQQALERLPKPNPLGRNRGFLRLPDGGFVRPWAMATSTAEPYPFAAVGEVPISWLSSPIKLPTTDGEIVAKAVDVISDLIRQLDVYDEAQRTLPNVIEDLGPSGVQVWCEMLEEPPRDMTTRDWLEHPSTQADTVRLNPDVSRACALIEGYANAVVPAAIRNAYHLHVELQIGDPPLTFRLFPRGADQSDGPVPAFGTEAAADGHRIWIQLAFLEAIAALLDRTAELDDLAERIYEEACRFDPDKLALVDELFETKSEGATDLEPDLGGAEEDAADLQTEVADTLNEIRASVRALSDALASFRAPPGAEAGAALVQPRRAASRLPGAPLYVIDEPERHLHPRVLRQFAAWLRDLVRVRDSQALLVTHSVPFINQADTLAYVRRQGVGSSVRACDPHELSALGEIAAELGLDRGQLLADITVILFVEGPSDQYVLEGLFPDRLRQAGVAVVPLHGATQLAQVADSQLLLRFSTAKIAVMLDNLTQDDIQLLHNDREHLEARARSKKTEERMVARLLLELANQGREVAVLGVPTKDIFDILDPDAIRHVIQGLSGDDRRADDFADYPGHEIAQADYEAHANAREHWKKFCARRYGIPMDDLSWYSRVADKMRADNILPPALVEVVDRLELLAT